MSQRPALILRSAGILAMVVFSAVAASSAADRLSALRPVWEVVVPAPLADNAWRARAVLAIRRGDAPGALAAARRAVDSGPVDADSTDLLGTALLLANQPAAADRAFAVAGRMGWRSAATQKYLMGQALARDDYGQALMHLDALLRQSPQLAGDGAVMQPFEESGAARTAWIDMLERHPPWLGRYAREIEGLAPSLLRARGDILQALGRRGHKLDCETVGGIVTRLLTEGAAVSADALWRAHCPAQSQGLLGDGDFAETELAHRDSLFSWASPADSEVSVAIDPRAEPSDPRLVVASSAQFEREIVNRMIYLPPGRYTLHWRAITAQGRATDRVRAVLSCRQQGVEPLATSLDQHSGVVAAPFSIDGECQARWLSFRILPGADKLRFGNVRIDPVH
ncbi:MAG TPA: hypothetical protein VI199_13095 [Novosphingobium sp.]